MGSEPVTAYLVDASGVIYTDGKAYPGVVKKIASWQAKAPVYIATNNTSASPVEISASLATMGIYIPLSHILSSGLTLRADPALKALVWQRKVFLLGRPSTAIYVTEAGGIVVSNPLDAEVFVLAHTDGSAEESRLCETIMGCHCGLWQRPVICVNPDRYVVSGGALYPVVGTLAATFTCHWAGKPHDNYAIHVVKEALLRDGIVPNKSVLFVDDNPENVQAMCRCLGISGVVVTETGLSRYAPWRALLGTLDAEIRRVPSLCDIY